MAYAHVDLVASAGQQNFTFDIPYLSQSNISVLKNGVLLATPADWTFLMAQVVRLTVGANLNDIIRVKRITPIDEAIVDYANGSVLGENELDATALQSLFAAQEVADSLEGAITQNEFLQWDAQNLPIINIPVSAIPSSAVRRDFADSQVAEAQTSANNAASSATNSANSAAAAAASAAAAENAEPFYGTSATSVTIPSVPAVKVFTTQAGKQFEAGAWLLITDVTSPQNFMHGYVLSYTGTTLEMNVTNFTASGITRSNWDIRVSGTRGAVGAPGSGGGTPSDTVVSEETFGLADNPGILTDYSRADHTHGTPTNPVTAHEANSDPHTGYQKESEKDVALGYAGLSAAGKIISNAVVASSITNDSVTNSGLADMAVNTIKGRITSGTGDPENLTASQVRTIINVSDGANNYVHPNHSGDVTSIADGAQTIANNVVTFAKMQDISTDILLGRDTAASGDPEQITVGGGIEFTGSTGIQRSALTGDVTASAGSNTTAIADNAVTNTDLRDSAGFSVIGKATTGSGDPADIVAGDETVLGRTAAGNLAFAQVAAGQIASNAVTTAKLLDANVTYAKIQDVSAASKLLGRGDSGAGDVQELTVGSGLTMTGTTLSAAAGSAHSIEEEGTPVSQRSKLNFIGTSVTVTDNAGDDATEVTITGGTGGDSLIYEFW